MRILVKIVCLIPLLAANGQIMIPTHTGALASQAAAASACGSTTASPAGDYWAGSYSASPITTNWTDSSTFNNPMSPAGSPTWAATTFGAGLAGVTMNGTNQVFGAVNSQFPGSSAPQMSAYVILNLPSGGGGPIIGSSNNNSLQIAITQGSPGSISLVSEPSTALCSISYTFTAGTTYEVAVNEVSSTGACNFYVNGSSIGTGSFTPQSLVGPDTMLAATRTSGFFNGSIYEVIFTGTATYDSAIHTCWAGLGLP